MRRKDILIISAILIIIAFGTVFAIYYVVNDGEVFPKVQETIANIVPKERKEYYANGWETSIIKEIRDNVPIPEGFTYVEGKEKTGLIIEDETTKEKYMWIPTEHTEEKAKEYVDIAKEKLNSESYEGENVHINESTEKYGGFYVAIKDKDVAEEEYLKQNTSNYEEYKELKSKLENKEIEAINFASINTEEYEEKIEAAKKKYEGARAVEANAITKEQLANVLALNELIGQTIYLNENQVIIGTKLGSGFSAGYKQFQQEFTYIYEELEDEEDLDTHIKWYLKTISEANNQGTLESIWLQMKNYCMNNSSAYGDDKQKYKSYTGNDVRMDDEEAVEMFKDMFLDTEKGLTAILDGNKDEKWDKNYGDDYVDFFRYCFVGTKKDSKLNEAIEDAIEEYEEENKNNNNSESNNNNSNSESSEGAKDVVSEYVELSVNGKQMSIPIPAGFTYEKTDKYVKIKNGDNLSFVWIPVDRDLGEIREELKENMQAAGLEADAINAIFELRGQETITAEVAGSINKYKGFYISEAEVGEDRAGFTINIYREMEEKEDGNLGVANGEYNRTLDINGAKETAASYYEGSSVVSSHLTYGVEWDAVVNYVIHCGDLTAKEAFIDSNAKGKYKGNVEYDGLLAGMFGLGGNLNDITQETKDGKIVTRGGCYADEGTEYSSIASAKLVEANSNDEILTEQTGYRIVLTVNEKRKFSENLQEFKDDAIIEIEDYIKNGQWSYINAEIPIIKGIEENIVARINAETSTQIISKIVDYGKQEISNVESMLAGINDYGVSAGYTYGEEKIELNDTIKEICNKYGIDMTNEAELTVNNICWKIKAKSMDDIKNATYINYEGTNGGYNNTIVIKDQIQAVADKNIEAVRKNCKEKIYNEEIEGYITQHHNDIANESWIQEIKKNAKQELMYTEDLVNIRSIAAKYQKKIEEGKTSPLSDSIVSVKLKEKLDSWVSQGKIEKWGYEGKTAYMVLKENKSIFQNEDERTFYYIGGEYLFMAKSTILGLTTYKGNGNPAGITANADYNNNVKEKITGRRDLIKGTIDSDNVVVRTPMYEDMVYINKNGNDLGSLKWGSPDEECWYDTRGATGGAFSISGIAEDVESGKRYTDVKTGANGDSFYYRPVIDIDKDAGGDENTVPITEKEEERFLS